MAGASGMKSNPLMLNSKSARSPSPVTKVNMHYALTGKIWLLTDDKHEPFCLCMSYVVRLHSMYDRTCEITIKHRTDINQMEHKAKRQKFCNTIMRRW
jgi:hypothetical protein